MAAVQQCTHTPVDARQRRAFIESMEDEIRRVSEHLEQRHIRRGSYKATHGMTARSGEMVNGYSHSMAGGGGDAIGHEPGASAGISSRKVRVNRYARQLSVPPEESSGSCPSSNSSQAMRNSRSPSSPAPLSAPPVGGRRTTWSSERRLRRREMEDADWIYHGRGRRSQDLEAVPAMMPTALPTGVVHPPLPSPVQTSRYSFPTAPPESSGPPHHDLVSSPPPPPLPPRTPKAVPPPPPPLESSPSPSPSPAWSPTPDTQPSARSQPLAKLPTPKSSTPEAQAVSATPLSSSVTSLPAGTLSSDADASDLSTPEIKTLPVKASSAPPSWPTTQTPPDKSSPILAKDQHKHTTVTTKHEFRPKPASKIHITVSSMVDKSRQQQPREDLLLPGVVKDLRTRLKETEEKTNVMQRNHESELKERDEQIKKLNKEGHKLEREKWELLKRARDGAERSLHLRTQLELKEGTLRAAQVDLERARDELISVKSANTGLRALLSELRAPKSSIDVGTQVDLPLGGTLRRNPSIELALTQGIEDQDSGFERSTEHRMSTSTFGDGMSDQLERTTSIDSSLFERESRESTPLATPTSPDKKGRKKRGYLFGRMRRSSGKRGSTPSVDGLDMSQSSIIYGSQRSITPIVFPYSSVNPEMHEHWRVLEEFKAVPFNQWNVRAIVAWMEAGIGMSQYTAMVRERVTSGHALLALTDSDMERRLGIANPLHRRKLRLAIEDYRTPGRCQYPQISKIDQSWVAFEWASDCGFPHLTEVLMANLVDGRVLNSLSKDDLKRLLKISRKSEQLSFLSGVELLRMHEFNREAIQDHRRATRNPLYWTNRDVCDWLNDIQLGEHASYILGSGVHGALLFLERGNFTSEQLANILHIPHSKAQIRRKLASKMALLFSGDLSDSQLSLPESRPLPIFHSPERHSLPRSPERLRYPSVPQRLRYPLVPERLRCPSVPLPDCPHPARANSLSRTQAQFHRTSSNPSFVIPDRMAQVRIQDRARLSLRESALRSVAIHEEAPVVRSLTPTILSSSTTV